MGVDATWGSGEAPRDVLGPIRGEPAFKQLISD